MLIGLISMFKRREVSELFMVYQIRADVLISKFLG